MTHTTAATEAQAPASTGTGTQAPASTEPTPDELIAADRERIDELDARITDLVRERMAVSARIQRTRIATGGRRVHLARETRIIARYSEALGRPGTALAMTLLELCRGAR
jgi:chorismate mutase